jgi:hypothetical protein
MVVQADTLPPPAEAGEASQKREPSPVLPSSSEIEAAVSNVRVCGLRLGSGLHGPTLFCTLAAWCVHAQLHARRSRQLTRCPALSPPQRAVHRHRFCCAARERVQVRQRCCCAGCCRDCRLTLELVRCSARRLEGFHFGGWVTFITSVSYCLCAGVELALAWGAPRKGAMRVRSQSDRCGGANSALTRFFPVRTTACFHSSRCPACISQTGALRCVLAASAVAEPHSPFSHPSGQWSI